MHLCLMLQSRLNELKEGGVKALTDIADRVRKVESFEDFEKMREIAEQKIKEKVEIFEGERKEMEGLKLNFEEELKLYLGVDDGLSLDVDDDGYITNITYHHFDRGIDLKNVNPDLSYLEHLAILNLYRSNVQNMKLPKKSLKTLSLERCPNLIKDFDCQYSDNIENIVFDYTNIEVPKLPYNKLKQISYIGCTRLGENYDISEFKHLQRINLADSSVVNVFISPVQYLRMRFPNLFILSSYYTIRVLKFWGPNITVKKSRGLFNKLFNFLEGSTADLG